MDEHTRIITDCETGETTTVPLTPEELTQREADAAAAQAAEQARQQTIADADAKRQQSIQTLMAAMPSDAVRDALADILGVPQGTPA